MNINIDYKELKDYELYTKDYGYRIYEILQDRTDVYLKNNRKSKTVILNLGLMKEYNMDIMDMAVYGLLLSMAKDIGLSNTNAIDKKKYISIANYQISELLGLSLSTVKRSIALLKKHNLIEITHTNNKVTNRIILI